MSPLRAAVVGAGPAGLAALVELTLAGIDATCFEKGDRPGGIWAYKNTSGLSAAYRTLHLNTSRGRTEFARFPMPAGTPDYPSHFEIGRWLEAYAGHFGARERIRFECGVEQADPLPGGGWELTLTGGARERFDVLVVASGHNWEPRWPDPPYPGEFSGLQMHAHDFDDSTPFAGKRVLVVGMGNSAMDIAVESSQVAERTLLSVRTGSRIVPKYMFGRPADQITRPAMTRLPWRWRQPLAHLLLRLAVGDVTRYGLPAPAGGFLQDHPTVSDTVLSRITHGEVLPVPAIDRLDEGGVIFSDGRREPVDVIVWCTGYRVTIPYLSEEVLGAPPDELPLYLRIFPLDRSDLLFCGLIQSTGSALPIVERQGELMAAYLAGSWALPSQAEQRRWVERHRAAAERRYGRKRPAMRVDFDAYMRELARERSRGARRAGGSPPLQPRAAAPAGPVPA